MQAELSLNPLTLSNAKGLNLKALAAQGKPDAAEQGRLRRSAEEFEASFLTTMLEQMWTGIDAEAPFGGGHAEKVYRSMMVGEFANSIAGGWRHRPCRPCLS